MGSGKTLKKSKTLRDQFLQEADKDTIDGSGDRFFAGGFLGMETWDAPPLKAENMPSAQTLTQYDVYEEDRTSRGQSGIDVGKWTQKNSPSQEDEATQEDEGSGQEDKENGASQEAQELRGHLHKLHRHLDRIDLETMELLGYNPESVREATEVLEKILEQLNKRGEEIIDEMAIVENGASGAVPTWKIDIGSFTEKEKAYTVYWDIKHYENANTSVEALEEEVEEPHYSCTCESFEFGSHDGKYCKHIDSIIQKFGGEGVMPDRAEKTGSHIPSF